MNLIILLTMGAIAAWGMAFLITNEDGPFFIFARIREFDFCRITPDTDLEELNNCIAENTPATTTKNKTYVKYRNAIIGLVKGIFSCICCANPYTALIVLGLLILTDKVPITYDLILYWLYIFSVGLIISVVQESFNVQENN